MELKLTLNNVKITFSYKRFGPNHVEMFDNVLNTNVFWPNNVEMFSNVLDRHVLFPKHVETFNNVLDTNVFIHTMLKCLITLWKQMFPCKPFRKVR